MSNDKSSVIPINFPSEENSLNISSPPQPPHRHCLSRLFYFICHCFSSSSARTAEELTLLPKEQNPNRKTLVLDLDETLVHSSLEVIPDCDLHVKVKLDGSVLNIYVLVRPGTYELLEKAAEHYEIVIFTASLKNYADPVIDFIDRAKVVSSRLYRSNCLHYNGNFIKNLSLLGRDLKKVVIVDNSPMSYIFHPHNAIAISSWYDDQNDRRLFELLGTLQVLSTAENVQIVLKNIEENRMELSQNNVNIVLEQGRCALNSPKTVENTKFEFKEAND